jgi:hypothetical protein
VDFALQVALTPTGDLRSAVEKRGLPWRVQFVRYFRELVFSCVLDFVPLCLIYGAITRSGRLERRMSNFGFRSSLRKLVAFFRASRDKWKQKCQEAKYELKLLKRRFENLQARCDQWQQRYQAAEAQRTQVFAGNEHLQASQEQLQAQLDLFSKKGQTVS